MHNAGGSHSFRGRQELRTSLFEREPETECHDRKAGELVQKFDGLIVFIDVGMSRGVAHSNGAVLHIGAKDRTTPHALPDFARLENGRLVYDVGVTLELPTVL